MARDPKTEAMAAQTGSGYSADLWLNVELEAMTKLWQGIGGSSNFFISENDAREARGAYAGTQPHKFAETLWRLAQVQPSATLGYRQGIREYVVDIRTPAAMGVCLANPALGSGSVVQYYIPNWQSQLHPTGREFKFGAQSYPKL
jgi:hypothetical protein